MCRVTRLCELAYMVLCDGPGGSSQIIFRRCQRNQGTRGGCGPSATLGGAPGVAVLFAVLERKRGCGILAHPGDFDPGGDLAGRGAYLSSSITAFLTPLTAVEPCFPSVGRAQTASVRRRDPVRCRIDGVFSGLRQPRIVPASRELRRVQRQRAQAGNQFQTHRVDASCENDSSL